MDFNDIAGPDEGHSRTPVPGQLDGTAHTGVVAVACALGGCAAGGAASGSFVCSRRRRRRRLQMLDGPPPAVFDRMVSVLDTRSKAAQPVDRSREGGASIVCAAISAGSARKDRLPGCGTSMTTTQRRRPARSRPARPPDATWAAADVCAPEDRAAGLSGLSSMITGRRRTFRPRAARLRGRERGARLSRRGCIRRRRAGLQQPLTHPRNVPVWAIFAGKTAPKTAPMGCQPRHLPDISSRIETRRFTGI
jgi:hypothetical protein